MQRFRDLADLASQGQEMLSDFFRQSLPQLHSLASLAMYSLFMLNKSPFPELSSQERELIPERFIQFSQSMLPMVHLWALYNAFQLIPASYRNQALQPLQSLQDQAITWTDSALGTLRQSIKSKLPAAAQDTAGQPSLTSEEFKLLGAIIQKLERLDQRARAYQSASDSSHALPVVFDQKAPRDFKEAEQKARASKIDRSQEYFIFTAPDDYLSPDNDTIFPDADDIKQWQIQLVDPDQKSLTTIRSQDPLLNRLILRSDVGERFFSLSAAARNISHDTFFIDDDKRWAVQSIMADHKKELITKSLNIFRRISNPDLIPNPSSSRRFLEVVTSHLPYLATVRWDHVIVDYMGTHRKNFDFILLSHYLIFPIMIVIFLMNISMSIQDWTKQLVLANSQLAPWLDPKWTQELASLLLSFITTITVLIMAGLSAAKCCNFLRLQKYPVIGSLDSHTMTYLLADVKDARHSQTALEGDATDDNPLGLTLSEQQLLQKLGIDWQRSSYDGYLGADMVIEAKARAGIPSETTKEFLGVPVNLKAILKELKSIHKKYAATADSKVTESKAASLEFKALTQAAQSGNTGYSGSRKRKKEPSSEAVSQRQTSGLSLS